MHVACTVQHLPHRSLGSVVGMTGGQPKVSEAETALNGVKRRHMEHTYTYWLAAGSVGDPTYIS